MRDKRNCGAVIGGSCPCSRGKELNDLIGSIQVNPFNGLSITIGPHACEGGILEKKIEDIYGSLLEMPVKHLTFNWSKTGNTENCPLGQLIMRLMRRSLTLEHLHIKDIPTEIKLQDENRPEGDHYFQNSRHLNFLMISTSWKNCSRQTWLKFCQSVLPVLKS